MKPERPDETEDRLQQLFAATAADAPPPDQAVLAALRERSTTAFAGAQQIPNQCSGGQAEDSPSQSASRPQRTSSSITLRLAVRSLFAVAAIAAVVFLAFLNRYRPPTLGESRDGLLTALSYQEEYVREIDGKTERARLSFKRIANGGVIKRLDYAPGKYVISGERGNTWIVDESQNTAIRSPVDTFLPNDPRVGSLVMLCAAPFDAARNQRPLKTIEEDGREFFVYQSRDNINAHDLEFVWRVDAKTHLFDRVQVFDRAQPDLKTPVAVTTVQAAGKPIDDSVFRVKATLTEDGRIGKVTDWQGNVALRPMTSTRWTPVCDQPILRMGDWLRTDFQGANAVTVQLVPQTKLILGPGSLVELTKPDQVTLHSGIAEISASPKTDNFSGSVKLSGPGGSTMDIGGVVLVRANDKGLVTSDKDPPWLAGYKGNAVVESLGSLVATIDGRRVPLTVGYHKVSVEIRDQIARTTIEESFVNHTDQILEGQFHFPLPADASISGFGMWIGTKLVEADVVEKQRAREIYETILREKRDPGLLEWTGGNIFKARVYPIPANSEKRIKIVYTQVLPRKGDTYRFSYALQSDLLRQNPLRQLDFEVTVSSTHPLATVTCPTHLTRNQLAEHAARVEFSAQKYTPTRDFEVVVQTAGQTPDVVFIPHRRGEDGYFLLQLQPPAEGTWQRDVLPDGEPLHLLVLADTSASMDAASRKSQAEVLAALLGSLSPKDTFNLAACDVDCTWTFDKPLAAEEKNVTTAREALAKRRSLGWTNLDRAFESVAKQSQQGTQVVYLGDGIVTTGDMDGPAFVSRLGQMLGGKGATLHAVAVSSSYDSAVLRGIAGIGGGSLRQVSGEIGPQQTVKDLLAEMTRPALRNIQLEFKGLRTARVYPRVLPNVPAGTQQIVLGRFQPQENDQRGEVIVTGTLDGKLVTYPTTISAPRSPTPDPRLPTSGSDASFIPRLWARMHLDELLAQGTSQEIQDEIINLSEEFHIITPYTSLLVLETDADRERFKVKRRFQMRDGERFFADARDVAQYQLVQQQMQRAGLWRRGLREHVLMSLASLGREQAQIQAVRRSQRERGRVNVNGVADFAGLIDSISNTIAPDSWADVNGPSSIRWFSTNLGLAFRNTEDYSTNFTNGFRSVGVTSGGASGLTGAIEFNRPGRFGEALGDTVLLTDGQMPSDGPSLVFDPKPKRPFVTSVIPVLDDLSHKSEYAYSNAPYDSSEFVDGKKLAAWDGAMRRKQRYDGWNVDYDLDGEYAGRSEPDAPRSPFAGRAILLPRQMRSSDRRLKASHLWDYEEAAATSQELARLSPLIPFGLPVAPPAATAPRDRKSHWPEEAQQISRSLKTKVELAKVEGGLAVEEQTDALDTHRGRLESRSQALHLASAKSWLMRREADGYDREISWANADERGILSSAYELALVRKAEPADWPATYESSQWWQAEIEWSFQNHTVEVQKPKEGQALLILKHVIHPHREFRILIDSAKSVVLAADSFERGKLQSSHRAEDFVEVAGAWLPQKIETLDDQGRVTSVTTRKFEVVPPERFATRMKEELAARQSALTLKLPLAALHVAKDRLAKGLATLEDRLVVLVHLAADQKWPEAHAELARIEPLVGGKSFAAWMKLWLLEASRRNEELRQLVLSQANSLAAKVRPGERTLLDRIERISSSHFSYEEQLAILDALKPVYARLPEQVHGPRLCGEIRQGLLQNVNRDGEQLAVLRELVRDFPSVEYNHRTLARWLIDQGEHEAGYEVLKAALARPGANWSARERDLLYEAWADHLKQQGRWADQAALVGQWLKLQPEDADPFERYLACLVYTRREVEADELTAQWLQQGLGAEPLPKVVAARVEAAVETATGDNSHMANGEVDPRFLAALAELLVAHAGDEEEPRFLSEISSDYEVRRTDEYRAAATKILARLKAEAATLPLPQLQTLVSWCISYAEQAEDDDWKAVAAALRPRWEAATHPAIEQLLAGSLLQVLSRISDDERLALLRLRLAKSDEDNRAGRASALFEALLETEWSAEIEAESLALIDKLSLSDGETDRLRDQIIALYRWTDRMEAARFEKLVAAIERPDKLTRTELDTKRGELHKQVRSDLAARLKAAAAGRQDGLKRWLTIEQLTLETRLERELPQIVESGWELLGPVPPAAKPVAGDEQPSIADELDAAFRARVVTMLLRLAIRPEATAAEAERLLKYFDASIAALDAGIDARLAKYVLLVGIDKPQPLVEQLAAWSKGEDRPQLWQRTLAYLKAELGDLEGAVALAEPLAAADALDAADYRALAGWYQALKRDAKHHEAQVAAWKQMDEWRLRDVLRAHLSPWENTNGPSPGAIDPQLFLVLKALFEKAGNPSEHVYLVRSFYEKSRDFRLVAVLADAVVGQSAGNIYRFLKELDSTLEEIDLEATVDELLAHVAQVRERAKSPSDQRALDLLSMLAEQRAAEVKNQPGPHAAAAVAALIRATKPEWSAGEARLFAQLLADLGQITQRPLSDERIRVLQSLHATAAGQSQDRLTTAHALADSLIDDGHHQEAIDVLEPALAEHRQASGGKVTWAAVDTLRLYGDQLGASGNFVQAETMYRGELARAANQQVAAEIRSMLYRVHVSAIDQRGSTSLGQGVVLYRAVEKQLIGELLKTDGQAERYQLVQRLCDLYATAHRHEAMAPAVKVDVVAFGQNHLPGLLDRQIDNYQEVVERVERTMRDTAGYLPALTFLVSRLENEPAWLARKGDDGWRHFAWELGILHDEVRGKLGELEPRLLKIVLTQLRRDLATQTERRRVIYHDGSTHFWKERTGDFVRVAEEVLAEQPGSPRAVMYISDYLYNGVGRHDRGIAILLDAHRRQLLDDEGRSRLVIWLQEQQRFGESIAYLESLVKEHPDRLGYRIQLLHAYYQTKQPEALRSLLAETDKSFHEEDRWSEDVAAQLAVSCLQNELLEHSVEYLKEAIKRREESLGGQVPGDRTLAQYYIDRAYAYAGLANTNSSALDACSAAVVWGVAGDGLHRRYTRIGEERGQVHPLDVLRDVLAASPNLDEYVAELDQQVAESNEDRPIVRKSLGEVYFNRHAFDRALTQLKLAVELSPSDGALHAKLVETFDALMQPDQAAQQLFASVELARRDVDLWFKLSERLERLEQPAEAERARTSLVEMLPTETEGHTKLAKIRQSQDRWDEAIDHWRHVTRLRKLEPAGLLGLAAAQIHQKQRADAEKTLKELETTDWPARFHDELRQKQLPKLREELSRLPQLN